MLSFFLYRKFLCHSYTVKASKLAKIRAVHRFFYLRNASKHIKMMSGSKSPMSHYVKLWKYLVQRFQNNRT